MTRIIDKTLITEDNCYDVSSFITEKIIAILEKRNLDVWDGYNKQYVVKLTVDEIDFD